MKQDISIWCVCLVIAMWFFFAGFAFGILIAR
jgi:hypothetical protein